MKFLSFDLRALALMRIGLAIVIILDLGIRFTDLEAFYSDSGVLPLSLLHEKSWNQYFFSVHTINGIWQFQLILFTIAFICAIFLLIGYRTQLFTIFSWILLTSLHNRNLLILQGGDDLLRIVLFWGMFLPLGSRYSCDNMYGENLKIENSISTIPAVGYILQICYVYTGSALLKGIEWNQEFTALYYIYSLDQIAYSHTKLIYYYPSLLKILTAIAFYFELLIPILFFIPIRHHFFRIIAVFAIMLFHLFNFSNLFIGLFPIIGIVTILGILPTNAMDFLENRLYIFKKLFKNLFKLLSTQINNTVIWKPNYTIRYESFNYVKSFIFIFLIILIFDWNISNTKLIKYKLSEDFRFIGYILRLDQNWGMFAPNVLKDDGWYILEGTKNNGTIIDLGHPNEIINYNKPQSVVKNFKNDRWRKYFENFMMADYSYMRLYFCNYQKRIWNENNPQELIKQLKIVFMTETTLPNYQKPNIEKADLCYCN